MHVATVGVVAVVVAVAVVVVLCRVGSLSTAGWRLQSILHEAGVKKAAGPG
tara:strand:+ start:598 stop:750 length:153 start_codon:yes stop_codon:yes gene_type:complete